MCYESFRSKYWNWIFFGIFEIVLEYDKCWKNLGALLTIVILWSVKVASYETNKITALFWFIILCFSNWQSVQSWKRIGSCFWKHGVDHYWLTFYWAKCRPTCENVWSFQMRSKTQSVVDLDRNPEGKDYRQVLWNFINFVQKLVFKIYQ